VGLVDDDGGVFRQQKVVLDLSKQNAVGHKPETQKEDSYFNKP
jgi:hypothetical protein